MYISWAWCGKCGRPLMLGHMDLMFMTLIPSPLAQPKLCSTNRQIRLDIPTTALQQRLQIHISPFYARIRKSEVNIIFPTYPPHS